MVPQELIDHIVDFTYDDHQTLCTTRLVCSSWNISARVHFFRKLDLLIPRTSLIITPYTDLSAKDGVHKFKRLLDILNTSPDMPYFVKEVIIGNTTGVNPAQWKIYDPLLSNIVAHLKRVTTIYVREVDWSQLSPSFFNSLTQLSQSPQLQDLDMWNCQLPSMEILLNFLNFSCAPVGLRLSHIRFSNEFDGAKALLPTLAVINKNNTHKSPENPLQRLSIENVPLASLLYALLTTATPCSIVITQLRCLILDHIDDIPTVRHFLQVTDGSLESLELRASTFQRRCGSAPQGTIDLSLSRCLKYLRVYGLQWTPGICPAECLCLFFQSINTSHSLESLRIITTARKRKADELDFTQWSSLDGILSRPAFSALQKVQILVYSPFMSFTTSDANRLANAFSRLQANRKIHVKCI